MNKNVFVQIDKFAEAEKYWLNKLSGDLKELKLATDFPDSNLYAESIYKLSFESGLSTRLTRIAKNNDLSLYIILLASFKLLLFKYTGLNDILVASPIYNKSYQEYNKFVVLRDNVGPMLPFKEFLMKVTQTVVEGYKNGHFPIGNLIETLGIEKHVSLFRTVLSFENIHDRSILSEIIQSFTNDISVSVWINDGKLEGEFIYNAKLFETETIQRLAAGYLFILNQVTADTSVPISDLELVSEEERNRLLFTFNAVGKDYPEAKTLHELLQEQVEKTPGKPAVTSTLELINIYDEVQPEKIDIHLSYEELNENANRLARLLREEGVRADTIVGLMVQHPLEMVIGIFAILKAGGAYLPIDCDYTEKIKNYILAESNIDLLVLEESVEDSVPASFASLSVVYTDDNRAADYESGNLEPGTGSSHLAYAIFTSGTTGMLKGVLVEHKGIVNYTLWRLESYRLSETDVTLQLLTYCFDGFGSNFYSSLLSGGNLVIVPAQKRLDYDYIKEAVTHFGVTNTSLVPGMYEALLDCAQSDDLASIRFAVLAGEKSTAHLINKSREKAPHISLINEYGPTEASVTAASHPRIDASNPAIIGGPIANVRLYILDSTLKPLPVEVPGELYIGGRGVARAYLNHAELTKEKFLDCPFADGETMYRTGDLVRWLPDGTVEFLRRMDSQAKIRGYRIELEYIENQLLTCEWVNSAAVITKEHETGETFLCAYVVSEKELDVSELREYLLNELPEYMIPSYFIPLERIPLTPNGKVNKRALPDPDHSGFTSQYIAPRDHLEKELAEIWGDVLGVETSSIGIDSNFFQLGGHSLKATIQAAKIHKTIEVNIPLSKIFQLPTIRKLAEYIRGATGEQFISIPAVEQKEYYPLSSAQKRLYILQQMHTGNTSYNLPMKVLLEGELDIDTFKTTFERLIERHESFRTSFKMVKETPVQVIHKSGDLEFDIEYYESREEDADTTAANFLRPFVLENAPLLRVGLIRIDQKKHILLVDMHHIITDGISMEIFKRDFMALFNDETLPELRIQYKDFTVWQNKLLQSGEVEKQESYWLKEFSDTVPVLKLPTDFERPKIQSFEGTSTIFEFGQERTAALKNLALEENTTLFMVLVAVFNVFLFKLTLQENIVIGTPIAGRRHADLENVIGFLVGTLAIRNYPSAEKTFRSFLADVKKRTLDAFENQEFQFDDLVAKLELDRDASRNPIFDVLLVLENVSITGGGNTNIEIPGLKLMPYEHQSVISRFDLVIAGVEEDGNLRFLFEYSTNLFKKERIERFINYLLEIVTAVTVNRNVRLKNIEISHNLFDQKLSIPETDFAF